MITKRPSNERGQADHGWLQSQHSFSFAQYYDPEHMNFRSLRVINEDWIAPNSGFPKHPHRDMEIITYVVEGTLTHKDSMGHTQTITLGEVQAMSAGSGVYHSEYNNSDDEAVHMLQIWITPEERDTEPRYDQKRFDDSQVQGRLQPVVSQDGRENSIEIGQDVVLFATKLEAGEELRHSLNEGRHAWLQLVRGKVSVNGTELEKGDAAAASKESELRITASEDAEFLLFDLA